MQPRFRTSRQCWWSSCSFRPRLRVQGRFIRACTVGRPRPGSMRGRRRSAMTGEQIRKVYLDEDEDFSERQSYGRRVVTPVRYSTDPRDVGWVRQNIPCQTACPADTNVPAYIQMILENRYGRSYELNRIANVLPGTLGRICSRPCEDACRHGWPGNGAPVNICHLKRAAADHKPSGHRITENLFTPSGKRIAIVGAGSAGIAAAHDLSMLGHDVTIFEAEKIAGRHAVLRHPRVPPAARRALGRGPQRAAPRRRAARRASRSAPGRTTSACPACSRTTTRCCWRPAAWRRSGCRCAASATTSADPVREHPERRVRPRLPDGAAPRRDQDGRQAGRGGRRRASPRSTARGSRSGSAPRTSRSTCAPPRSTSRSPRRRSTRPSARAPRSSACARRSG